MKELLGLVDVHSEIYGKMNAKSIGGAKHFLTFIDDRTRYVWVYPLKHKGEAFDRFLELKLSNGRKCQQTEVEGFPY